ncbi:MAG TPA: tRNA preQ1(34) S-adenosylmethionine ribosyltransferase-isomerase QueA [Gemmataceae bacterium]|nr:tRNA preQ1(34) S-adenosylmethionine ribosyltransferase-isomerase QueA [Gemmataceae bacterium]
MSTFPFDYTLPPELIAQEPSDPRDESRLLVADRTSGSLHHHRFRELPELLRPGDLLVLNDTRVLPARLLGKRARTGGKWEGLYLRQLADSSWEMLCQTRGSLQEGEIIEASCDHENAPLTLQLIARLAGGRWQVKPLMAGPTLALLERFGHIPLPPYIRKGTAADADKGRYQTIYALRPGAVAAPTAGLHFTNRVFADLAERGIRSTSVTLHVGVATFQPIQVDDYSQHPMHREWGALTQEAVDAIAICKSRGGRVVAVGTTSVRVLESVARLGPLQAWTGETDLFIHPPYDFKVVDALITNFHLPRTTLLLLVAAFAGADLIRRAYAEAIAERYRFFSYGDAMLIT